MNHDPHTILPSFCPKCNDIILPSVKCKKCKRKFHKTCAIPQKSMCRTKWICNDCFNRKKILPPPKYQQQTVKLQTQPEVTTENSETIRTVEPVRTAEPIRKESEEEIYSYKSEVSKAPNISRKLEGIMNQISKLRSEIAELQHESQKLKEDHKELRYAVSRVCSRPCKPSCGGTCSKKEKPAPVAAVCTCFREGGDEEVKTSSTFKVRNRDHDDVKSLRSCHCP